MKSLNYALEQHNKYKGVLESAERPTLEVLAMLLLQARGFDGRRGRRWDEAAHLFFDDAAESALCSIVSKKPNEH